MKLCTEASNYSKVSACLNLTSKSGTKCSWCTKRSYGGTRKAIAALFAQCFHLKTGAMQELQRSVKLGIRLHSENAHHLRWWIQCVLLFLSHLLGKLYHNCIRFVDQSVSGMINRAATIHPGILHVAAHSAYISFPPVI